MVTRKRRVEVFTAGCVLCEETVKMVRELACPSCEVVVYDIAKQCDSGECMGKVKSYGISRVPTVVVDGRIADCCAGPGPDPEALKTAGVGRAI